MKINELGQNFNNLMAKIKYCNSKDMTTYHLATGKFLTNITQKTLGYTLQCHLI